MCFVVCVCDVGAWTYAMVAAQWWHCFNPSDVQKPGTAVSAEEICHSRATCKLPESLCATVLMQYWILFCFAVLTNNSFFSPHFAVWDTLIERLYLLKLVWSTGHLKSMMIQISFFWNPVFSSVLLIYSFVWVSVRLTSLHRNRRFCFCFPGCVLEGDVRKEL